MLIGLEINTLFDAPQRVNGEGDIIRRVPVLLARFWREGRKTATLYATLPVPSMHKRRSGLERNQCSSANARAPQARRRI